MALLTEEVRSAYVRAVTEMDLFVLAKPDLRAVIDEEPELEEVLVQAMKARQPAPADSEPATEQDSSAPQMAAPESGSKT